MFAQIRILFFLIMLMMSDPSIAADLIGVYRDALENDPVYLEEVANKFAIAQNVPITLANLLPSLGLAISPFISKTIASGNALNAIVLPNGTFATSSGKQRGYVLSLNLNQVVFDFAQFQNFIIAKDAAKAAQANLNAALLNLMMRVANAYFTVLEDIEKLTIAEKTKASYAKEVTQIQKQYRLQLKTSIDLSTMKTAYQKTISDCIQLRMKLIHDREILKMMTGKEYDSYQAIGSKFPMILPLPNQVDDWLAKASTQNWSIKSVQYDVSIAKKQLIKQFGNSLLPTLVFQGGYDVNYTLNMANAEPSNNGNSRFKTTTANLLLNFPILQGGQTISLANQLRYQYQSAEQRLVKQFREVILKTKENFYGIVMGIDKLRMTKDAIYFAENTTKGLKTTFKMGQETLINVLYAEETLYDLQKEYIANKYQYLNSLIGLKEVSGTLNIDDLIAINQWLVKTLLVPR